MIARDKETAVTPRRSSLVAEFQDVETVRQIDHDDKIHRGRL